MPLTVINGPKILAGESLSEAVDVSSGTLVRITCPAEWTGSNLTFQISSDGQFFNDVFMPDGTELTMVVISGAAIPVAEGFQWSKLLGHMKFRSGTRKNPVPVTADREFAIAIDTSGTH